MYMYEYEENVTLKRGEKPSENAVFKLLDNSIPILRKNYTPLTPNMKSLPRTTTEAAPDRGGGMQDVGDKATRLHVRDCRSA